MDSTGIIDSVRPIGQTKKGEKLYLLPGQYTTEKYRCTVGDDLCVYAGNVTDLNGQPLFTTASPYRRRYVLDVGDSIQATANTDAAMIAARYKLVDSAVAYLSDTGCYRETVKLDVDFISLGDTAEYRHLRELEGVHLYDTVTLKHKKLGITAVAQVTRIEYDVLLDKINAVSLGTLNTAFGAESVVLSQLANSTKAAILAAESRPRVGFKTSVTLPAQAWISGGQNVYLLGVEEDLDIIVSPDVSSVKAYTNAGVCCTGLSHNALFFECTKAPTTDLTVDITIFGRLIQW